MTQQKTALITGITGQDGSYLAEFLLGKGYIVQETQPDEIYNLGAQSHVAVSFESPEYTADVDGMGTLRILEAIRILGLEKKPASIRPLPPSSMAWCRKPRSGKPRPSTRAAPTPWPSSMPTGSRSTTAKPTACTPATASCSTTKAHAGRDLRHPQDHPRRWPYQAGPARLPVPGQHGFAA